MALIKLYEASAASVPYAAEAFYPTSQSYYLRRHDCVVLHNGQSYYKIYRDGTVTRVRVGDLFYGILGYDADKDLMFTIDFFGRYGGNKFHDPVGLAVDPSKPSTVTTTNIGDQVGNCFWWHGFYYAVAGASIYKHNAAGAAVSNFALTGTQSFVGDRVFITQDGILVALDADNGTQGVARFYDLYVGVNLYESVFDASKFLAADTVNKNIWTINTSDKLQVWSFQVAPANFAAITMGANRARYREDTLSVILRGSVNEPVPYWPVAWSLTTAEGGLEKSYTVTDSAGVATNRYCGPGLTDYVGAAQTITVSTGY